MTDPYAAYLETNVLCATPLELVRMLYGAALEAVRSARACLAKGEIPERARAVSRAVEILAELNASLDLNAGELPSHLARLYDYIQRRLLDGNFQQADAPLAEAQQLLETLADAWNSVADAPTPTPAEAEAPAVDSLPALSDTDSPWGQSYGGPVSAYATEGWTL